MTAENLHYISQKLAGTVHNKFPLPKGLPIALPGSIPLSYLLAGIFEHWIAPAFTQEQFEAELGKFNAEKGESLMIADFETIQWIRKINGRIILPNLIKSLVRNGNNWIQDRYADRAVHIRFLISISGQIDLNHPPTISKIELEDRLEHLMPGQKEEGFRLLMASGCLTASPEETFYSFRLVQPHSILADEIAARLWKANLGQQPTHDMLRNYLQKLVDLEVWPHFIGFYLTDGEKKQYSPLLESLLTEEPDLWNSEGEYAKVLLDSSNARIGRIDQLPTILFEETDSISLVRKAESLENTGDNLFIIQPTRNIYELGLNLLLQTDIHDGSQYRTVLALLKDIRRPYVVLKLYENIHLHYPAVLPYLLTDLSTMPLVFLALEELDYRRDLMSPTLNQEEQQQKAETWRQEIRADLVREAMAYFDRHTSDTTGVAFASYQMLDILLLKAFSGNMANHTDIRRHRAYLKEYHRYFNLLAGRKINVKDQVYFRPFDPAVLQHLALLISQSPPFRQHQYLELGNRQLYHVVELLKIVEARQAEAPHSLQEVHELKSLQTTLINFIRSHFEEYLTGTEVMISRWPGELVHEMRASRGLDNPFFDATDWAYVLLTLTLQDQFEALVGLLNSAIEALPNQRLNSYSPQINDTAEKIRTILRISLLAFIRISEHRGPYASLPIESLLPKLESLIASLAKRFSGTDPKQFVDLFDNRRFTRVNLLYPDDLLSLLFKCADHGRYALGDRFIVEMFRDSLHLDRMLRAINEIGSSKIKDLLTARIEGIDLKNFMAKLYSNQLTDTLISAVNSDRYWRRIGSPLITRLQQQLKRRSRYQGNLPELVFELRLLIAFKGKSMARLQKIPLPDTSGLHQDQRNYLAARKEFIIAAFLLYHHKAYDAAIAIFNKIFVAFPHTADFAVHRFRAKTTKAVDRKDNALLINAFVEWDGYFSGLTEDQKQAFNRLTYTISSTTVHYYAAVKDYDTLDTILRDLPDSYKYDVEIVLPVTQAYRDRHLMSAALTYISDASEFNISNGIDLPPGIVALKTTVLDEQDIEEVRSVMKILQSLPPRSLPRALPDVVNEGKNIEDFVLHELVFACKIMVDKIEGLRAITKENRLNDLVVALLRVRFNIWGWSPEEQPRIGTAKGGKDAGLADILIRKSGDNIALVECLKVENDPQEHIIKVRKRYTAALRFYYLLNYVTDPKSNLDRTWKNYKAKVNTIDFLKEWGIGKKGEKVIDIELNEVPDNMRIGKTLVGDRITLYHILVKTSL